MQAAPIDPDAVRGFEDQTSFARWLASHHADRRELWLKLAKAGAGIASVTYKEALDVALCWGWIDGQKRALDETHWLQRFTPRGGKSVWSKINCDNVERLIREGRMQPEGLAKVDAAKADGRWARAYEGAGKLEFPHDLLAAIEAEPQALELFERLNSVNRYALALRTHNIKTAAGRQKRIASFVEMLKRGETIYPNVRGK